MSGDQRQPWAGSTSLVNRTHRLYFGDLPSKLTFRGHPFPRPGPWLEFYGPCPITLPKKDLGIKSATLSESLGLGSACITGSLPDYPPSNLIHSVKAPGHQLKRPCVPVGVSSTPNPRNREMVPKKTGQETAST
jgi:hypothetical protein